MQSKKPFLQKLYNRMIVLANHYKAIPENLAPVYILSTLPFAKAYFL